MKTLDIEIALLKECKFNQNLVVPNVSFGIKRLIKPNKLGGGEYDELHECDILKVTPAGYATEYEIKVSKKDFLADKKKKHNHDSRFIKQTFFVVPEHMKHWALENLPSMYFGLAYVTEEGHVYYLMNATERKDAFKWTQEEMFKLAKLGAMRIYTLKKNIQKKGEL